MRLAKQTLFWNILVVAITVIFIYHFSTIKTNEKYSV